MTAIANVTLNSVVYYPSERSNTTGFIWVDRTSPYSSAQGALSYTGPLSKGQYIKRVGFKLDFPQAVTADSACGCVGDLANDSSVTIYVDVDTRQTVAQLTDLVARIQSLVASSVFTNAVETLQGVY